MLLTSCLLGSLLFLQCVNFSTGRPQLACSYSTILFMFMKRISLYLSINQSIYLSIYLPIYRSIYLSIGLSIYLSIYLSIHLFLNLSCKKAGSALKTLVIFLKKGTILVTAVETCTNIPHGAGLEAVRKTFNKRETTRVYTERSIKSADFMLENNFFEFNGEMKRWKSRTAIGNLRFFNLNVSKFLSNSVFFNCFVWVNFACRL